MRRVRAGLVSALAVAATACGGGGASPPASPPRADNPPNFLSASAVSVGENRTDAFYTVLASDPDGNPITYTMSGGSDVARFAIGPNSLNVNARDLRFIAAPDFEFPVDANGDNVYELTITASDGVSSTALNLRVTVTNVPDTLRLRRAATGFNEPIAMATFGTVAPPPAPTAAPTIFVAERGGKIRLMNWETGAIAATNFLDISSEVSTMGSQGLLGFALSPAYATDRKLYVLFSRPSTETELREYQTSVTDPTVVDYASHRTLLLIPNTLGTSTRRGGLLTFGRDGLLFIGTGDGNFPADAQSTGNLRGKLLRIDPRVDDFPMDASRNYGIPAGNPFATSGGLPEIVGLGLRDPFRGFADGGGDIYIGDIGENALEELNNHLVSRTFAPNFGWNLRQGTQPFNGGASGPGFVNPSLEYAHGTGPLQGSSITSGFIIGPAIPFPGAPSVPGRSPPGSLSQQYIFGDRISKNIWTVYSDVLRSGSITSPTITSAQFVRRTAELTPDAGTVDQIVAFAQDAVGFVYIVDFDGEIFRIEQAP